MRIAICEDIKADSQYLYSLIKEYLKINSLIADIDIYSSSKSFIENFEKNKYQIIFQDIYMDDFNGIETAKKKKKVDEEVSIIFTTTSLDHGIESYQVDATYYIVKPVLKDELTKSMLKCQDIIDCYAKTIEVMQNRQLINIRLKDINYIEAMGHNSIIYLDYDEIKINLSFGKLVKQLNNYPFIVSHRSYLVNLTNVIDKDENLFFMKNGDSVPISKTYSKEANDAFREFFWNK